MASTASRNLRNSSERRRWWIWPMTLPVAISTAATGTLCRVCDSRGPPFQLPRPHREHGLRAVQGLDLRLLVHAEDDRLVRGIQVQTHDVADLVDQQRIRGELEAIDPVWPEPKSAPDAADRHRAHSESLGHVPGAPVGRGLGLALQGQVSPLARLGHPRSYGALRARLVEQAIQPAFDEARPPLPDRRVRQPEPLGHTLVVQALGARQYDRCRVASPWLVLRRRR